MAFSRLPLITGIAFVLFSCVQPVGLKGFVDHLPKPPIEVDIDYEVSDESPSLQWSPDGEWWAALDEEGTVTVSLTASPGTVIIQVMDQSSFAGIAWYCDSPTPLTLGQGVEGANREWLVKTPGTAPFTDVKTYQMVVVGTKGGQQYGTSVFIKVVN
jgi:hypothetical protein